MTMLGSPNAIRKTLVVRCSVDHAFRTWTEQMNTWWPKSHSRSGNPSTTVLMETRVDGRLYERTPDNVEYEWGKVIVWEPPHHFAYHWYLGSGSEQPTRVDVHFIAEASASTRIEVHHQGPELIGERWSRNCAIYDAAWAVVLPAYGAVCQIPT